ncbi:MAG TPA: cytochrome-c peroxidase, partial [Chitinophagaceae bacterium]|nr:cytochrome-c peroxidase [Chitinophagaceae bacterium]
MKGKLKALVLVCVSLLFFIAACKKDVAIPEYPGMSADISFSIPQGWPAPYYSFKNNQLTNSGFALGRKLFYDVRLSRDNSTSCGTCHQSFAAFANADHALSHGVDSKLGVRNSPALFNLNWNTSFMWDGGVNHIEVQPLAPITNPVEMDETMNNVLAKIGSDPDYKKMYQEAFGSAEVSTERTFKAL